MNKIKLIALSIAFSLIISQYGFSQVDIKGKVKEKTTERTNQRTEEGIDKGLDKIEEGVGNLFKKKEKKTEEPQTTETTKTVETTTKPNDNPKIESYTKYDFVPGDQILFFDDFSKDAIGDFPALWATNGSGEVRTVNQFPGNYLYMNTKDKVYNLMKNMALPKNFIFEFDMIMTAGEEGSTSANVYFTLYNSDKSEFLDDESYPGNIGVNITMSESSWEITSYKDGAAESVSGSSNIAPISLNKLCHVIVWVQGRRLRIYHEGKKTVDLPTIIYENTNPNRLRFSLWNCTGLPYISNIKFTTAAPDTRSKLITEGKLISYGISFDSGKDIVKPESYGALSDIAKVLKENPNVKIKIIGHTDSDGDDAKNLDLSKRRAANVKQTLVKDFGINANNIQTDGKGETQEIAPNTTPEGKAKNRRVEFIKM
jgi:flagellar motor protein MotB